MPSHAANESPQLVPDVGISAEKTAMRRRIAAARAGMPASERESAGRQVRDHVLALPEVSAAGTVAAYYSIGTEPATHSLIYALWKRGSYVVLPLLMPDSDLDWASYEGPDSLVPGPRGLLQPAEPPRGPGTVSRADVVLVPALAVDLSGSRLGRGGGSYDRVLARVGEQVPVIALLYDVELVDAVPTEPHDQKVRLVARPTHGITHVGKLRRALVEGVGGRRGAKPPWVAKE
jgi:5-formyltetrahydrofolate cyclo-ligase